MIVMMIMMVTKNLIPKSFVEMVRDLVMLIIIMMRNLIPKSFMEMVRNLIILFVITMVIAVLRDLISKCLLGKDLGFDNIGCDYYNDDGDEEFNRIRFHGVSKNYQRVHDHCHDTGKYRGDAYSIRNLRHKTLKKILVVFYNGSNYH